MMCPLCGFFHMSTVFAGACVRERACMCPLTMRMWACAYFELYELHSCPFCGVGWTVILSPWCHVLWNMLAAFVVPLPVLLFWHFHTMVHLNTGMLLSLPNYYSLNSTSQERLASRCRVHGTRHIIEGQEQGLRVPSEQR